jgi:hypothetical protein
MNRRTILLLSLLAAFVLLIGFLAWRYGKRHPDWVIYFRSLDECEAALAKVGHRQGTPRPPKGKYTFTFQRTSAKAIEITFPYYTREDGNACRGWTIVEGRGRWGLVNPGDPTPMRGESLSPIIEIEKLLRPSRPSTGRR